MYTCIHVDKGGNDDFYKKTLDKIFRGGPAHGMFVVKDKHLQMLHQTKLADDYPLISWY